MCQAPHLVWPVSHNLCQLSYPMDGETEVLTQTADVVGPGWPRWSAREQGFGTRLSPEPRAGVATSYQARARGSLLGPLSIGFAPPATVPCASREHRSGMRRPRPLPPTPPALSLGGLTWCWRPGSCPHA